MRHRLHVRLGIVISIAALAIACGCSSNKSEHRVYRQVEKTERSEVKDTGPGEMVVE